MELADFLLARIAEDEEAVRDGLKPDFMDEKPSYYSSFGAHRDDWGLWTFNVPPARVLAECEAKRRIVEAVQYLAQLPDHMCMPDRESAMKLDRAVVAMAAVYADHADYRSDWAP